MSQRTDVLEERFAFPADCDPARVLRVRIERPVGPAPDGGRPVAVVAHGFKGFMDWGFVPALGRALAEAGFVTLSFNASGSGIGEDPEVMDDEEAFFHDTFSRQLTTSHRPAVSPAPSMASTRAGSCSSATAVEARWR